MTSTVSRVENTHLTTSADDRAQRAAHDERFYASGTPEIPALAIDVLTKYAGIPQDEVKDHVVGLRDRAYAVSPYPCIGRYRFLTFSLASHPLFESYIVPTLLATVNGNSATPSSATESSTQSSTESSSSTPPSLLPAPTPGPLEPVFLDIGTCLGQDLRLLLHRGVAPARIYGTDIEPAFFPLGYELFRDAGTFPRAHQLAPVDLFDGALFVAAPPARSGPSNQSGLSTPAGLSTQSGLSAPTGPFAPVGLLAPFAARVDVLHISAVFHLFSYNDQVAVGRRILSLMRPPSPGAKRPAAVIVGRQTAHAKGMEYPQRVNGRGEMLFRHNAETWEAMWLEHVAPGGVVGFANGQRARLRLKTDLDRPRGNLPGLVGAENDRGSGRADPHFMWMKFEIWLDVVDDG